MCTDVAEQYVLYALPDLLPACRCMQLRVQTYMILLAAIPGFAIAKQLSIVFAPHFWIVLVVVGLVEFVYGSRL